MSASQNFNSLLSVTYSQTVQMLFQLLHLQQVTTTTTKDPRNVSNNLSSLIYSYNT